MGDLNYDQEINKIVEAIKADKSIAQPWRNKASARLEEVRAFVRMGLQTTYAKNPIEITYALGQTCTCPFGVLSATCPVHHGAVL